MDEDIIFKHVSYAYDNVDTEVIEDISFKIKAGTTFGILGGTGSGKSTLMALLVRLYELKDGEGTISIGNIDIKDIRLSYLRQNIGMVLQEPFLFSRTLKDNISIARPSSNMQDIEEAVRIASLDETVNRFDKGYETYVGEKGVTLSGGQKQRTAIAQMLIRKPPIMIFDDSLSAVDAETDAKIRSALQDNTSKSTKIIIAHRITTLMNADYIIVLEHGHIKEEGTHQDLLAKNGIYKKIYDLQSAEF